MKIKILTITLFCAAITALLFVHSAKGAITKQISYQGKLTDTSNVAVADGNYNMVISIYTAVSGGTPVWTARGTTGAPTARTVAVANGIFSIMLGDTVAGDNAIGLDFNSTYYLGIKIGTDSEMSPRKTVGASGYAFNADLLDGLDSATSGATAHILATDASGNATIDGQINTATITGKSTGGGLTLYGDVASGTAGRGVIIKSYDGANWRTGLQYDNVSSGTPNLILVPVVGSVGVGTSTPSALFSVGATSQFQVNASGNVTGGTYNGNTISTGTGTLNLGSYTLALTGSSNINQNLLTTSAPTFAGLTINGTITQSGTSTGYISSFTNTNATTGGGLYIRSDGTGNLLTLNNLGTDIFTISPTQAVFNVPTSFSAAGDVAMAYDLIFTNQTSSNIKTNAPFTIETGEIFESNDLTLRTFNAGGLVLDTPGGITSMQAQAWALATSTSALNFGSGLFNLDSTNGRVGVGTVTPSALFSVGSTSQFQINATGAIASSTGMSTSGAIVSTLATGTAPFTIASTTVNTNLNSDLLDGQHGSYYASAGGFIPYTGGTSNVDLGVHNLTVDTNSLFVDSVNHRVGIGTISPAVNVKLQIETPESSWGVNLARSGTLIGGLHSNGGILTLAASTGGAYLSVANNSSIGVGTTTPVGVLDVKTAANRHWVIRDNTFAQLMAVNDAAAAYVTGTIDANPLVLNGNGGGNVGIGNTSPTVGLELGSVTAGKSQIINATEGAEMAPALEAVNWTGTDGWSAGSGVLTKVAGSAVGSITPSGTFAVTAGRIYKVVFTCSAVSGNMYYSIGSGAGRQPITATTYTEYVTASSTGKISFGGGATVTGTITSLSVKELTPGTGDLSVYGRLALNGGVYTNTGAQVMDITSQGNVGIGGPASNAGYKLYVTGATMATTFSYAPVFSLNTGASALRFDEGAGILAQRSTTLTQQQNYRLYNTYTDASNYERLSLTGVQGASVNLTAETAGTGGDNLNVVLTPSGTGYTILNGNVGIGITAPLQKLQIGSNTSSGSATPDTISLGGTYSTTAGANAKLRLFDNNAGAVYGLGVSSSQFDFMAPTGAGFNWYVAGAEKMRMSTAGNIGIGTSSPTNILSLGNAADRKIWIENTASGTVGRALTMAAGSTVAGGTNITGGNLILQSGLGTGTGASDIFFQTGTTLTTGTTLQTMSTKMTILGNGNVGIGTAVPDNKFQINDGATGASASELLSLKTSYTNNSAQKSLTWRDSAQVVGQIDTRYDGTKVNMVFGHLYNGGAQTADLMAILGNGNVGIGDITPDHMLDVAGNIGLNISGYVNFGDTDGTSGYGFHDNAGVLQYKNSGSSWKNIGGMEIGGAVTSGTAGSVYFGGASGVLAQDNSNFFWDDTNNRLGLGTTTPGAMLSLFGANNKLRLGYDISNYTDIYTNSAGLLVMDSSATSESVAIIGSGLAQDTSIQWDGNSQDFYAGVDNTDSTFKIGRGNIVGTTADLFLNSSGNFGIGTSTPSEILDVNGRLHIAQTTAPGTTIDKLYNVSGDLYWNGGVVNKKIYTLTPANDSAQGGNDADPYIIGTNGEDILIVDGTNLTGHAYLLLDDTTPAKQIDVRPHDVASNVYVNVEFTNGDWNGDEYDLIDWSGKNGFAISGGGGKSVQLIGVAQTSGYNRWSSPSSSLTHQHFISWEGSSDMSDGYEKRYSLNYDQWFDLTGDGGTRKAWDINGSDIYYNTGNVGIGTTTPAYALDVVLGGDDNIARFLGTSSGLRIKSSATTIDLIGQNGDDTAARDMLLRGSGTSNGLLVQGSTGYVGIGTTGPSKPLDVRLAGGAGTYQAQFFNPDSADGNTAGFNLGTGSGWNIFFRTNQGNGWFEIADGSGAVVQRWNEYDYLLASTGMIGFSSETNYATAGVGARDLGLARNSGGMLEINNGTAGQYANLQLQHLYSTGTINMTSANSLSMGPGTSLRLWDDGTNSHIISNDDTNRDLIIQTGTDKKVTMDGGLSVASLVSQTGLGGSTYFGEDAGRVDDLTSNWNAGFGTQALYSNTSGSGNVAMGYGTLHQNSTGIANAAVGSQTLYSNTIGQYNSAFGALALAENIDGNNNTAAGEESLTYNQYGDDNVSLGYQSLFTLNSGNNNIALGSQAGYSNFGGSGNIFLGYQAGYNETGSNKLYIENSNISNPLIYGDFSTDIITINGKLGIGASSPTNSLSFANTAAQKIWIENTASGTVGRDLTMAAGGTVAGGTDIVGGNLILQSGLGTGTGASNISFQTGTTLTTGTTLQTMSTKMTILGNGNVGIGETNPTYPLVVAGTANGQNMLVQSSALNGGISVKSTSTGGREWGLMSSASGASVPTSFRIMDWSTSTDRFVINANGRIGIAGATLPTSALTLGNGSAQKIGVENSTAGVVGRDLTVAAGSTITGSTNIVGGNLILQSGLGTGTGTSDISFQTGTTLGSGTTLQTMSTKMTIMGNGNVGIGTTAPTRKLTIDSLSADDGIRIGINGGSLSRPALEFEKGNTSAEWSLVAGAGNNLYIKPAFASVDTTDADAKFTITQAGDVGIGTTSPSGRLHLKEAVNNPTLLYLEGSLDLATIGINSSDLVFGLDPTNARATSDFAWNSDGAEKMRLDNSGYLGIGTISPTNILSLGNTQAQKIWIENTASGTVGRALTMAAGGTVAGGTNITGGNLILQSGLGTGTGASDISFQTGTTLTTGTTLQTMSTKMTILGNGNVGIGITLPLQKLQIGSNTSSGSGAPDAISMGGTYSTTAGANPKLRLYDTGSGVSYGIGVSSGQMDFIVPSAAGYAWHINGVQNMEMDTSGNLGIGTSSPTNILSLGNTQAQKIWIESATNGSVGRALTVAAGSAASGYSNTTGGNLIMQSGLGTGTGDSAISFQTGTTLTTGTTLQTMSTKMTILGNGNVGIGTTTPGALLDVGLAGTTLGTIRLAGDTSGYVQLEAAAAAGSWTMTLPDSSPSYGFQLTGTGGTTTGWASAGSLRSIKNIDGVVTDPNAALNQMLNTNIYDFHYKTGMGTGDSNTQYVGVMADEAQWAMHYNGNIINPVNTLGYMVLGVKALNNKISTLETLTTTLQQQIAELQAQVATPVDVAQIDANTQAIDYLNQLLGITPTSPAGDVTIVGKLTSQITETGAMIITVNDVNKATIGDAAIAADQNSIVVTTTAVSANSKIYVTPTGSTDNQVVYVKKINSGQDFEVGVDRISTILTPKEIKFNWWIVEEK